MTLRTMTTALLLQTVTATATATATTGKTAMLTVIALPKAPAKELRASDQTPLPLETVNALSRFTTAANPTLPTGGLDD